MFLKLGCICFGGPAAHLGYFREEFVRRRRWIGEAAFAELIGLTQLLPGPSSSQTGFLIGIARSGIWGGAAAWAGFTLPSALLMMLFAAGIGHARGRLGTGALQGLQAAAVAVVAAAVFSMFRSFCPDLVRALIAIGAAIMVLSQSHPLMQIAAILAGGAAGVIAVRAAALVPQEEISLPVSRRQGVIALAVFAAFFVLLESTAGIAPPGLLKARAFYRTGSLVFGGGHVVLPLLEQAVVRPGWVDQNVFLSGYGAAQTLPGPLFTLSAYLGYVSRAEPHGIGGGVLCLFSIFLPGLLLAVAIVPFWHVWRAWGQARSILAGINAAVVGLLFAALFHAARSEALTAHANWLWAGCGFAALVRTRIPPVVIVASLAAISAFLASQL